MKDQMRLDFDTLTQTSMCTSKSVPRKTQFLPVLLSPPEHVSQHAPGLATRSRDCVTTISHGSALCGNTHTHI